MSQRKVITIVGTRPEAIKMAPVIQEIERHKDRFDHKLVTTAQHREMLDQILSSFGIEPAIDLSLMQHNQSLATFASRSLTSLSELLMELRPDCILVQGDTTTVMTAALAAFYQGVRIGHVEAGLRSFDRRNPFPEEINRRIAGCVSDMHFAPTERARSNLLREGVPDNCVWVTGNTIVDALKSFKPDHRFQDDSLNHLDFSRRTLLVTAHRRESHGLRLRHICQALKMIVERRDDVEIVYPVHLNPNVLELVHEELRNTTRIHLVKPVSYLDLLRLLERCFFVLTDSGGIQEEAPSFHKPVLVLRELTERPELIEAGGGEIVGTDPERIVRAAERLLSNENEYNKMSSIENPFGDGHAAERIVSILAEGL